jgi:hypothetical protein
MVTVSGRLSLSARPRHESRGFALQVDGPGKCEHTPGSLKLSGSIGVIGLAPAPRGGVSPAAAGKRPVAPAWPCR